MKIIVVGEYNHPIYAPAFYQAFAELGHQVIKHDYCEYAQSANRVMRMVTARTLWGHSVRQFNRDMLKLVKVHHPDMVFLYRCPYIYPETVRSISESSNVFSYHNDDPFANARQRFVNRYYIQSGIYCHINFVYRKKNIADFAKMDVRNARVLLPYFLKNQNSYIACDKTIDVAFVGHYEDDGRDEVIKALLDAGLQVRLFGDPVTWKKSPYYPLLKSIFGGEVRGATYNELLNRIKICLCFYSKLNHDTYTRRCFEIPAVKGVMLSEYTFDMDRMFPEGQCAVYFKSPDEAVRKVKYLLDNEEFLNAIGQNAYRQVLKIGGSEMDRAKEILEYVQRK